MESYLLILVSTVLANNFVLVRFLGLCPFMGVSGKFEGAVGMSVATMFVLTLSSMSSYLLNEYLLTPLGLEYLATLSFILVIAAVVQFTELMMRKTSPLLYRVLGIFLPLITSNCAVLICFSAMRERLADADVPLHFRGAPIALVTAGLMALAFMGFSGLARV